MKDDPRWAKLNEHDKDVVRLVVLGYSNKKVASLLGESKSAIAMRLTHIYTKLDLNNDEWIPRILLVRRYYDLGDISGERR